LIQRDRKALTNFEAKLPTPRSDLAHEAPKDPYLFDFRGLGKEANGRAIEAAN